MKKNKDIIVDEFEFIFEFRFESIISYIHTSISYVSWRIMITNMYIHYQMILWLILNEFISIYEMKFNEILLYNYIYSQFK